MTPSNGNDSNDDVNLDEVLFEYISVGNAVRVSAIDPITNTEVIVVGSGYMSHYTLKMNALRKLKYVMANKKAGRQKIAGQTQPRSQAQAQNNGQNSFRSKIPFKR